jgi:hypothetical protein
LRDETWRASNARGDERAHVGPFATKPAYALAVVVSHFCVVVWHLVVVANVNPRVVTPGFLLFLGVINLVPFVAIALLNTRVRLLAGWLLLIPFGLALTAELIS